MMNEKAIANKTSAKKKAFAFGAFAWRVLRFFLIFGLGFLILKPFVAKILTSFMHPDDLLNPAVNAIPKNFSLFYWKSALEEMNLSATFLNSLFLSAMVAVVQLSVSALVGYGLARFKFKGNKLLYAMVILIMLVPQQTYSLAQYLGFRFPFGLNIMIIDTLVPMFIMSLLGMGFKQGLYIYLFMTFFKGLPKNLEDAALIDGAGSFRTFWSVILPNSRAVIITVLLFAFSWQWTDISYPRMYFTNLKVIPIMISGIQVRNGTVFDPIGTDIARNAGCILLIIPLLVLFVFCQKHLTQSIARTGLAN